MKNKGIYAYAIEISQEINVHSFKLIKEIAGIKNPVVKAQWIDS